MNSIATHYHLDAIWIHILYFINFLYLIFCHYHSISVIIIIIVIDWYLDDYECDVDW